MLQILWAEREEQVRKPDLRSTSKKDGGWDGTCAIYIWQTPLDCAERREEKRRKKRTDKKTSESMNPHYFVFRGYLYRRPSSSGPPSFFCTV